MKFSFGWLWLCRLLICTAIAFLWLGVVQLFRSEQHYFEQLLPGSNQLLFRTGIILMSLFPSIQLAEVIGNNLLRKLWIRKEFLYLFLAYVYAHNISLHIYPVGESVYTSYKQIGLEQLWVHIQTHTNLFMWLISSAIIIPVLIPIVPTLAFEWWHSFKDGQLYRQTFVEGKGSGSKWASLHTIHKLKSNTSFFLNSKDLILGRALFPDAPKAPIIKAEYESHIITAGLTGSGKSTTAILPNLCQYAGNAIINDPKGELAMQTMRARSSKKWLEECGIKGNTFRHKSGNARAYVLDPFKETKGLPSFRYNLLSEIDINNDRAREMLFAVADGCVSEETNEPHFTEMAKSLIAALCAFVISSFPKEKQHLCTVLDLLSGIDPDLQYADPTRLEQLLIDMMKEKACGGLIQTVASKMLEAGDREKGSILTTAARSLLWVGDPSMRHQLSLSDFSFKEFHKRTTTVYLVLPDSLMSSQHRWLRTMISLSIILVKKEDTYSGVPTLLLLDEMARLSEIETVGKGFEFLRAYGVRIWGFLQSLEQLEKLYADRYDTILGNSTVQLFGINSLHTAKWASEMLGNAVVKKTKKNEQHKEVTEEIRPLLTPTEIKIKLGKNTNRSTIFPTDGMPLRLERCSFKPQIKKGKLFFEYSPFVFKGCFEDW